MKSHRKELIALRNGERPPKRSGEYWTEDEVRQLTIMFESGMGISEIAIQSDRSEISVYQQLEKRGFLSAQSKPRNRIKKERTMADCLCPFCGNNACKNCGKDCSHAGKV